MVINMPDSSVTISESINGRVTGVESFSRDFNIPIYIESEIGSRKAGSAEIIDYLFNKNFEIGQETKIVPMSYCSLRGTDGSSRISLNINNLGAGSGSITGGSRRIGFTTTKITNIDLDDLDFEAVDSNGTLIRLSVDKNTNIVDFNAGEESKRFNIELSRGCFNMEETIVLIKDRGNLSQRRTISEVRGIINSNPELLDAYENLKRLFTDYWWIIVPGVNLS
jgi:hypothetical protein